MDEYLIAVGEYAGWIGLNTGKKPARDTRNYVILVNNEEIEYSNTALRIWPQGRRQDGVIGPETWLLPAATRQR